MGKKRSFKGISIEFHSFIPSLRSFPLSFLHSFIPSFIDSLISFIHSFLHFIHSFLPSFLHSIILSFIHSFIFETANYFYAKRPSAQTKPPVNPLTETASFLKRSPECFKARSTRIRVKNVSIHVDVTSFI